MLQLFFHAFKNIYRHFADNLQNLLPYYKISDIIIMPN